MAKPKTGLWIGHIATPSLEYSSSLNFAAASRKPILPARDLVRMLSSFCGNDALVLVTGGGDEDMSETDLIALAAVHLDDGIRTGVATTFADLIRLQFGAASVRVRKYHGSDSPNEPPSSLEPGSSEYRLASRSKLSPSTRLVDLFSFLFGICFLFCGWFRFNIVPLPLLHRSRLGCL